MMLLFNNGRSIQYLSYIVTILTFLLTLIFTYYFDLSFKYKDNSTFLIFLFFGTSWGAIILYYNYKRKKKKGCDHIYNLVKNCLSSILIIIFITHLFTPFTYMIAKLNYPLYDDLFNKWDLALGFDWLSWFIFFKSYPIIFDILGHSYRSCTSQTLVIIILLSCMNKEKEILMFISLFVVSAFVVIVISGFMPALAAYHHLNITPDMLSPLTPTAPYIHIEDVLNLRNGTLNVIDFSNLKGLITFPSFHAALAFIFILVTKNIPFLRWFFIPLNILVIISTPHHGGHYFVDVFAGIFIVLIIYILLEYMYKKEAQSKMSNAQECYV